MSPLNRLTDLIRGRGRVPPDELRAYAEAVVPLVRQLEALYARWRQDLELDSGEEELANAASIQRWETASLVDRFRGLSAPAGLARCHAELETIAAATARASQQLSNGYRFHSSRARCDGQALMLEAEERFAAIRRTLARNGLSVGPDARDDAGAGP